MKNKYYYRIHSPPMQQICDSKCLFENTFTIKIFKMKKYIINFLVFLLLLNVAVSCKKHIPDEPVTTIPKVVTGKWKWIFTVLDYPDPQTGGPAKITPLNSGNTESMEFSLNTQWKKILNNVTIDSGTYFIEHLQYINPSNVVYNYDQLNYNRNGSILGADYYEIYKDTLVFNPSLRGFYSSLNVPYIGSSKWFVKQ